MDIFVTNDTKIADKETEAGDTKTINENRSNYLSRNEAYNDNEGIIDMKYDFEDSIISGTFEGTFVVEEKENNIEKADAEKILPVVKSQIVRNSVAIGDNKESTSATNNSTASPKSKHIIPTDGDNDEEKEDVSESIQIIQEMSQILNTKLSFKSIKICTELIEAGADHSALAQLLKSWRSRKAPKPQRVLGHFFDPVAKKEKKEWVW